MVQALSQSLLYSVYYGWTALRILATGDYHGNAEAIRKTASKARSIQADVIVVCGDITHFGSVRQARELLLVLRDPEHLVLFVPGNCDPPSLTEDIEEIESIHGKCRQVDSFDFLGVGGSSPTPLGTPFELAESHISDLLKRGFGGCHIANKTVLVSHSPPLNTASDLAFTGEHVGSTSVRKFIERVRPALALCGHIHEARGIDRINGTVVVNPGPARSGSCALIDVAEAVTVELGHL